MDTINYIKEEKYNIVLIWGVGDFFNSFWYYKWILQTNIIYVGIITLINTLKKI